MDQMRVTTVDVACVPGTEAAFAAASIANARSSVEEEDNARFDVLQDVGDDAKFVLVEIYDSPEGGASSTRPSTLVPIRPRSRGERRSLRTLSPGVYFSPPRVPRVQRPPSTPFISASDPHELHPDVRRFERRTRPSTLTSVAAHKETAHYARWRDDVADAMAVPRRAGKYVPVYPWRGLWGSGAAARRKASARSTPEEASFLKPRRDDGASDENEDEARSISHWSPYDRVRVVNADP
jgi:quinol monooxygenase YgiN